MDVQSIDDVFRNIQELGAIAEVPSGSKSLHIVEGIFTTASLIRWFNRRSCHLRNTAFFYAFTKQLPWGSCAAGGNWSKWVGGTSHLPRLGADNGIGG